MTEPTLAPKPPRGPIYLLIDGQNMAHRDYHAAGLEQVDLITRKRIAAMRDHFKADEIIAAFDDGATFRHELEPGYKAGRARDPQTAEAVAITTAALMDHGIPCLTAAGFEADDIIATFAARFLAAGGRVVVYSADKDLHQLITPGLAHAIAIKRKGRNLSVDYVTADGLAHRFGVTPAQWVDYRAMVGDKSDNIGGMPDVGPATAAAVLKTYGSLDAFYDAGDKFRASIGANQRSKLLAGRVHLPRLRALLTLRRDVPIGTGWAL